MKKAIFPILILTSFCILSSCSYTDKKDDVIQITYDSVLQNMETPRELKKLKQPISMTNSILMYTVSEITLYDYGDEQLLNECFEIIEHYENILSKNELKKYTSSIYALNNADCEVVEFPDDALECLKYGYDYSEKYSDFDITIGSLTTLWNVNEATTAPTDSDIQKAVSTIDYKNLVIDGNNVHLTNPDTNVDLGAIAKGFITDKVVEYLKSQGVNSAVINLGGNIYVLGNKNDDTKFKIGIREPISDSMEQFGYVEVSDMSLVSSGSYEQFFVDENTGITYSHILDKNTGYPINSDIKQITVFTEKSVDGDGLSTSLYGLGAKKAMEAVNNLKNVECIIVTNNDEVMFSTNIGETNDKKIKFKYLK